MSKQVIQFYVIQIIYLIYLSPYLYNQKENYLKLWKLSKYCKIIFYNFNYYYCFFLSGHEFQ